MIKLVGDVDYRGDKYSTHAELGKRARVLQLAVRVNAVKKVQASESSFVRSIHLLVYEKTSRFYLDQLFTSPGKCEGQD